MWRYNNIHVGDIFSWLNEKGTQHKSGSGWGEDTFRPVDLEFSFRYSSGDNQTADGYTNFGSNK